LARSHAFVSPFLPLLVAALLSIEMVLAGWPEKHLAFFGQLQSFGREFISFHKNLFYFPLEINI